MSRLARPPRHRLRGGILRRLRRRSERGAIAILVTVIASGGVLLGVGALAVDIGQIWAEREQLQSGAQSAAVALAKGCATDPSTCASQAAKASTYANSNAKDNKSTVSTICGTGTGMSACPAQPSGMAGCLGTVDPSTQYVEVRTSTLQSDDTTLLPGTFAKSLAGNGGYQGKQVSACSRVSWGVPASGGGLAVTMSVCEWNSMTSNGTVFQPRPDEGLPSSDGVIRLHGTGDTCSTSTPAGWDAPGGFGGLDETGGACQTTVSSDGSYPGNTGVSASGDCKTALESARANKTVLFIPIYDGVLGTGASATYHLVGFSAFVVTGYRLPSMNAVSWLTNNHYCTGSDKCIYGYFTTGLMPTAGPLVGGETDYGAASIRIIG